MVLSGTLREFILADVMQLLTQQKITGKLILNNGRSEGHIVFRNGSVVAAVREQESFGSKLFYYLTEIQQQPKNKVRELFTAHEERIADLTQFIETRNILSHQELESYALGVTLDITCSLFMWKSGAYHFDSMQSVDHLIPAGVDIPVENIVMEAMRRIDEWNRIRTTINEETIFVRTEKTPDLSAPGGPIENPTLYFYHRIDGISPVKALFNDAFMTEYRTYESLYTLTQDDLIRPLSESITRTIRAAINKNEQDHQTASALPSVLALLITIGLILILLLAAWLFRDALFSKRSIRSSVVKSFYSVAIAESHLRDAQLFARTTELVPITETEAVKNFSAITPKDRHWIIKKRVFASDSTEKNTRVNHEQ